MDVGAEQKIVDEYLCGKIPVAQIADARAIGVAEVYRILRRHGHGPSRQGGDLKHLRARVAWLHRRGMTARQIAQRTGCSLSFAYRWRGAERTQWSAVL